jgi:hypothetical protein
MQFTDPEEQTEFIAKVQSMNKAEQRDLLPTPEGTGEILRRTRAIIQTLALYGKVDRAFAKAAEKTGYFPKCVRSLLVLALLKLRAGPVGST